jgi:RNA polymerase sigma-70 factor (ECF subfamily)
VQPARDYAAADNPPDTDDLIEGLFRDHYPKVVGMLTRLMGDRGQAEELASDAFCKLSGRRGVLDHENLTAWLYRAATNAGLDALRSNARRKRREESAEPTGAGVAEDALQGMLRAERCQRVRQILSGLKPRDAQLLLLRANGLAYRELAESLGIQPGSVGTLLARAEAEFERKYRARYGEEV